MGGIVVICGFLAVILQGKVSEFLRFRMMQEFLLNTEKGIMVRQLLQAVTRV